MQIRDVMTRGVEIVRPNATLIEAARKMRERDVGVLPVCNGERLVGMVTDRDITVRATAEGRDPGRTQVSEVMSPNVDYLFADEDVREAARLMREHQIRRLPVVDRNKRLVGLVSLGDLATALDDDRLTGRVLEGVSEDRSGMHERGYGRSYYRGYDLDQGRISFGRSFGGYERGYGREDRGFGGHGRAYGRDDEREHGSTLDDIGRSISGALSEVGDRVRSAFRRGPKGYKRSDDRIREDVCERLADRDDIDMSEVVVRVDNGEVTLEGTVDRRFEKRIAEQIAESVRGVDDVSNQIRVRKPVEPTTIGTSATTATTGATGTTGTAANEMRTPSGMQRQTGNDVVRR